MTRRIGEHADAILGASDTLAELELQFAKARFAEDYRCTAVTLSDAQNSSQVRLVLTNARHPLLERNFKSKGGEVVPISVELEDERKQLIITGPNTGGKTVALKTIGLLALMAQCGMHLPAAEGSLTSVFGGIYADIGDEQSIEQSLSTFSSHVTRIVGVLRQADARSLVLLD